jgi:hypothetical protein
MARRIAVFVNFFLPVFMNTYCQDINGFFGSYFRINHESCFNCTNFNGLRCQYCVDMFSPERKGYDCFYC